MHELLRVSGLSVYICASAEVGTHTQHTLSDKGQLQRPKLVMLPTQSESRDGCQCGCQAGACASVLAGTYVVEGNKEGLRQLVFMDEKPVGLLVPKAAGVHGICAGHGFPQ